MIPLRDVIPSRTTPFVTIAIIVLNAVVFVYELALPEPARTSFLLTHGLIPAHATALTILTSMFLHDGWVHVGGNMLSLWIFGDNVEDRMGHGRFLVFYLLMGAVAASAQIWSDPGSLIPVIGASGAIAGVMGAYLVLFPRSRVLVLVFLVFIVDVVEIPAVFFLAFWFVLQIAATVFRGPDIAQGVAVVAHAAGFAAGAAGVLLFRRRERQRVEWWSE
jgi:membrane associated rhomboid family serine protease